MRCIVALTSSAALLAGAYGAPAMAACNPPDQNGRYPMELGWSVFSRATPPCYDPDTDTLTLSPVIDNLGPVFYSFSDGTGVGGGSPTFFNLELRITNRGDAGRIDHFIVDTITTLVTRPGDPINSGGLPHTKEAHHHQRVPPAQNNVAYQAYYIPQRSTFAEVRPKDTWTRTHFAIPRDPGQTLTWNESRMHHLDGSFILVITPVDANDRGNRLRGLVPFGSPSTQFAYENFKAWHFNPNITGTALNDLVSGSDGADNIQGGFGQDSILAYAGDDVVDGGDEADFIFPGSGNDTARGGPGDDVIGTGAGLDTVQAGDGNDYVRGSGDKDVMEGGFGADVFAFAGFGESKPGTARDQITDFNPFEDKIDLKLIDAKPKVAGNQAFTWIGWNKRLTKPGQLTAVQSGPNIIVKANSDTDGAAELEIQLSNTFGSLSASAFVL